MGMKKSVSGVTGEAFKWNGKQKLRNCSISIIQSFKGDSLTWLMPNLLLPSRKQVDFDKLLQ